MEWSSVGKSILKVAPMVGGLLLGPPGAALGATVSMIASTLGVGPDPEEILNTIKDPAMLLKLKELEITNRTELVRLQTESTVQQMAEETKRIQSVNETMRVEAKTEHWIQYAWRPIWGLVSAGTFLMVSIFICIIAYKAITTGDGGSLGHIPLIIGAFTSLFSIPAAILGIASWHRGKEKIEGVKKEEIVAQGLISRVVDMVK